MLNKIISALLFVILLPIFLVVSLIILIDDGLPIFFTQKRVGINKSIFYIIKFRTMKKNTEDIATHLVKNHKSQILKSGNFLRKYSIDEIPQIINIFLGHINFVGPRPALFNQYDLIKLREKYNIHSVKPGITGWAQVNGRDSLSINKKVEHDYYYFKNKSILLNFKIVYRTIVKVILAKNIKD
jgi:O-antigen biosynthesis protein WbqP